jgi:hypothetical protein
MMNNGATFSRSFSATRFVSVTSWIKWVTLS